MFLRTMFLVVLFAPVFFYAQSFSTSTALPRVLNTGTYYSNCTTTGNRSLSFTVTGVGVLNTTNNQLAEIDLMLRSASSKQNLLNLTCYIKSPAGTCIQIAPRMGASNYVATNTNFQYKFRSPKACLATSPDYQTGLIPGNNATENASGMFGIFATSSDMGTAFNGENADGTWVIYFGRSSSSTSFPDVTAASLLFGEPEPTNHSSDGDACVTAVPWDGGPICLSTVGKTPNGNSPGWTGGSYSGCAWNNSNDNNIWVSFVPTESTVCLNISGTTDGLQSIVVRDGNADGDNNPCTPSASGTYWQTVSCPRDNIYAAVTGTPRSHNHCFTATPGETYYIVVDGNAGAESDFYLTGISGLPDILPVTLTSFTSTCVSEGTLLSWETATELNNDYFTIERSADGENWTTVGTVVGSGTKSTPTRYDYVDRGLQTGMVYYRLAQTDYDGTHEKLKVVAAHCSETTQVLIVPNPSSGAFYVTGLELGDNLTLSDMNGRTISQLQSESQTAHITLDQPQAGCYFLKIQRNSGEVDTYKVIVQ